MFDLRKVKFSVDLVEQIFLNDLMHDDGDQQIEEGGWNVLQTRLKHIINLIKLSQAKITNIFKNTIFEI